MSLRTSPILFFMGLIIGGCNRTTAAPAQKSPDGTMLLATSVSQRKTNSTRYLCVIVDITDSAGKVLHHEVTPASDTQRWSIQWVSNDEVLLKSSDVGNYHIRRRPEGTWKGEFAAE